MSKSLLKLQIGPVQEFIAQARSTRDLWSGSYLLSWLMAAGIAKLLKEGGELIFPAEIGQPLIEFHKIGTKGDNQKALLTPNLPNLFVARVPTDHSSEIAAAVTEAIKTEWKAITDSVWDKHGELGIHKDQRPRFATQVDRFLSIAWQVTLETDDYAESSRRNSWQLDSVRQTRNFHAWGGGQWTVGHEKDSLSGKEESLAMDMECVRRADGEFKRLFKHDDCLGAITLVKRVWHLAYLEKKLTTDFRKFRILSTRGIAGRDPESNDDDEDVKAPPGEKYFAVLALDGDQVGKWISGDLCDLTEMHHKDFSKCLGNFALGKARQIVEGSQHMGYLIYAGGDDVLALLPADTALACARNLREAFKEATKSFKGKDGKSSPDCSVGIAIAHFKSPLQDVIREAQEAEKRAKQSIEQGGCGRAAVAVTLMKRSGEIGKWGCQWESGGIDLYEKIDALSEGDEISAKFPHRVCELLEPYRNFNKGLSRQEDVADFKPSEVIALEFMHAAERQGSKQTVAILKKPLADYLGKINGTQEQLSAVVGLCTTIAFASRNKNSKTTKS